MRFVSPLMNLAALSTLLIDPAFILPVRGRYTPFTDSLRSSPILPHLFLWRAYFMA
ncbi:MAG: hypothetical protein ACREOI_19895 [bacterium]